MRSIPNEQNYPINPVTAIIKINVNSSLIESTRERRNNTIKQITITPNQGLPDAPPNTENHPI